MSERLKEFELNIRPDIMENIMDNTSMENMNMHMDAIFAEYSFNLVMGLVRVIFMVF
jgi:hypothetical protein